MRLTLRSMLAYMDEILEPADRQDIGQKVEDSEFASNLMHRIRDVSRRIRLGAPKVSGRGMGLDPNTVAEYLDNELPGERVPDFEKVCLESDVHLAEVASCHQILALVLGTAADIDPNLRAQMYAIGSRADERAADVATAEAAGRTAARPPPLQPAGAAAAFSAADSEARQRPEVPDYLRAGIAGRRSKVWPIAIAVALAVSLLVAIISAVGNWDKTNPILGPVLAFFGGGDKPLQEVAQHNGNRAQHNGNQPNSDVVEPGDGQPDKAPIDKPEKGATDRVVPNHKITNKAGQGTNVVNGDAKESVTDKSIFTPPAVPGDSKIGANLPVDPLKGPVAPGPSDVPKDIPHPGVVQQSLPTDKPAPPIANPAAGNLGPANPPAVPIEPAAQRFGRLLSDQEVLLRFDPAQGDWHRAAAGSTFMAGDKLLVLPTYRPIITLSSGVTLQLAPETLIEFEAPLQGAPAIRLHYGRMVMLTTGNAGVKLALDMGDAGGLLVFEDAEAMAAIEAHPYQLPGANPEVSQPRTSVLLFGVKGASQWIPIGAAPIEIKSPGGLVLAGDPAAFTGTELPKWINGETIGPIDQRAGQALSQSLDDKRPLTQILREMADPQNRRAENKSLAARSLALVDEFEPLVLVLNDTDQRAVWPIQIKCLQTAIARGPEVAAKVRAAFEKRHGKEGQDLYRMLWGYSKEQLQGGEAARLVEYLDREDHDDLIYRVMAFHNLRAITGVTFNYAPEANATNRQTPSRRWKEQLKEGLIVPKGAAATPGKVAPPADTAPPRAPAAAPPAAPTPDVP